MTLRELLEQKGWNVDEILDQGIAEPNAEHDLMIEANFSPTPNVAAPIEVVITARDRSTDQRERVKEG
jgi:hypothetical protein